MALYKCQRCKKKKSFSSMDFSVLNEHMQGLCAACVWEQKHAKNEASRRAWNARVHTPPRNQERTG